jgi:choline dehydrogenase-like flavoprotein
MFFSVLHTAGLRVIDTSAIPGHISGHTNAAAILIGEMGSSFILQEAQGKKEA